MKSIITSSFNFVYNNKNPWIHKANELLHSAIILRDISIDASKKIKNIKNNGNEVGPEVEVIIKDWSIFNQATLLFGFFLENILKGIWIDKNNIKHDINLKKLPKELITHNLVSLSQKVDIELTKPEIKVLNQFTACIIWYGRYPVTVKLEEYQKHFKSQPAYFIDNGLKEELPKELKSIINKISDKINS